MERQSPSSTAPVWPVCWLPAPHPPSFTPRPTIKLAPGVELPEVAGHHLRRGRSVREEDVGEMTGGKFQISVHAAGELMPPFGVVDGVQNATVEMAHTAPYYFFGKDPTFALGCAIPFGLNSRQMSAWMYEGNGLKLMREFYKAYNIVNFPGGNTGRADGRLVPQGSEVAWPT